MKEEAALEPLNGGIIERRSVYLSHQAEGPYCLRLAIGNLQTSLEHVQRSCRLTCEAAGISDQP
jgi:hypothetical protein